MSVRDWFRRTWSSVPDPASDPSTDSSAEHGPPPTMPKPARGTAVRGGESTPGANGAAPTGPLPRFNVGERIADTYLVKRIIPGGMATVYVAHHERWKIDLVVKAPHDEILQNPDHRHRIITEAEAWTALGMHPHIAYCYFVLPLNDVPLLVIEYLDGGSLRDWIADGRCADLRTGLDLAIQACHGLEHAHARGLIHRDIKPENILLTADGTLKITDFGIARIVDRAADPSAAASPIASPGDTRGGMGTEDYMAPEQFVSAHDVDARADIFSLGVCLYEMFCGKRPYSIATGPWRSAPVPQDLRGDNALPKMLAALLQLCVDWDPTRRPASAKDLRLTFCAIYEQHFGQPSPRADLPEVSLEADGWNNRGVSYLELGKQEEALRCFAQALQTNPTHLEATFNQGLLQWRRAEIDDLEVLLRLEQCETMEADVRKLAIAQAAIHQERYAPDAARAILAPYPGLYSKQFVGNESSQICLLKSHVGLPQWIHSIAFTPDGHFGLLGCDGRTLRLLDLISGKCLRTIEGHSKPIHSVALTPNGCLGLSGCADGTLTLWNLTTGQSMRTIEGHKFEGHSFSIDSVALTSDGLRGLAGCGDILKFLDLNSGICLYTLRGHTRSILSVALTPDGHWGLSGGVDRAIRLWDLSIGRCLCTLDGHSERVGCVVLTPDGQRGLSGGEDGTLKFWDLTTGHCLRTLAGHRGWVNSVSIAVDGRRGLSGSTDGTLKLWDLTTGQCLRTLEGHSQTVRSVALTLDGRRGISISNDRTLKLWSLDASARVVQAYDLCRPQSLATLLTKPEERNRQFLTAKTLFKDRMNSHAFKALITLWNSIGFRADERMDGLYLELCKMGQPEQLLVGISQMLTEASVRHPVDSPFGRRGLLGEDRRFPVALTPDACYGLTGGEDGTLRFWNLSTGMCVRILSGSSNWGHNLDLWDMTTRASSHEIGENSKRVTAVALTVDGHHGLSGDESGILKLWDLIAGQCLREFEGHSEAATSISLTPDGRRVLSGSLDRTIKFWNLKSLQRLRTLTGHKDCVNSVALSGDGYWGLSGSDDHTLKSWDLTIGRCHRTFEGHSGVVYSVAFTPDGRRGLSGSEDGTLKLWDLATGQCLRTLTGHSGPVYSVALTADGGRGLSGGGDRALILWDLTTGQFARRWLCKTSICEIALTPNGCRALVTCNNSVLQHWRFIWSLKFPEPEISSAPMTGN